MVLISSTTVSAATGVSFTNIPTTYKELIVRWYDVYQNLVNVHLYVRVNSDTASVYNNRFHRMVNNTVAYNTSGTGNQAGFGFGADDFGVVPSCNTASSSTNELATGYLRIAGSSETGNRMMESFSTGYRLTTAPLYFGLWWGSCIYKPTSGSAITSIEFLRSSTQTIDGKFFLYGVK
jgi:hypothetical protein